MYPYPPSLDVDAAVYFASLLRGGPFDAKVAIHAGWSLAGFAAGKFVPDAAAGISVPLTANEIAKHLDTLAATGGDCGKMAAIAMPWGAILQFIIPLILKWISGGTGV